MVLEKKKNKAELQQSIVKARVMDRGKVMYGKGDWRAESQSVDTRRLQGDQTS